MTRTSLLIAAILFISLPITSHSSSPKEKEEADEMVAAGPSKRGCIAPVRKLPETEEIVKEADFVHLQESIGYRFKNPQLMILALRHSYTDIGHTPSSRGYERLEYLGDAVLELIMREMLWTDFTHLDGQELKAICSNLVDSVRLADISDDLKLAAISKQLQLGEFQDLDAFRATLLPSLSVAQIEKEIAHKIVHDKSDLIESIIGALYLDGGLAASKAFVQRFWRSPRAPQKIEDIFNRLMVASQEPFRKSLPTLNNPLLRRLAHQENQSPSLDFLGGGVLDFILSEFLYNRFPDGSEGILTNKYSTLTSGASLEELLNAQAGGIKKSEFQKYVGLIYLDSGLNKASDYILMLWTSKLAPKSIRRALKKNIGAPAMIGFGKIERSFKAQPPKKLLQDYLQIIGEETESFLEIENIDGVTQLTYRLKSLSLGEILARGSRKADCEVEVSQSALKILSAHTLARLILTRDECLRDATSCDYHLKLMESRLTFMGSEIFSYHTIAKQENCPEPIYRVEIEGKNFSPAVGEARKPEAARVVAAGYAIKRILKNEYKKAEAIVAKAKTYEAQILECEKKIGDLQRGPGETLDNLKETRKDLLDLLATTKATFINEELLNFYLLVCENLLREKGVSFSCEPFSKSDTKNLPVLTFITTCEKIEPLTGEGLSPVQAKLGAAISLVHKLMPGLKLKKEPEQEIMVAPVRAQPPMAARNPRGVGQVNMPQVANEPQNVAKVRNPTKRKMKAKGTKKAAGKKATSARGVVPKQVPK